MKQFCKRLQLVGQIEFKRGMSANSMLRRTDRVQSEMLRSSAIGVFWIDPRGNRINTLGEAAIGQTHA